MRILFVGDSWLGSNARSLAAGFSSLGADVLSVDTTQVSRPRRGSVAWLNKRITGSRHQFDIERVHVRIENIVREWKPDLLFGFKTIHLNQQRLLELDVPTKIHYSADDVLNSYNLTQSYLDFESHWDLIVTTKSFNVSEIAARSAAESLFVWSAYDPAWHHPRPRVRTAPYEVGFIGNRRADREPLIQNMANRFGSQFRLAGPGWRRSSLRNSAATITGPVYGESFADEVANIGANLVLLNSDNRDLHTCRSFEIPASGGLFVGEDTIEHRKIIEHGETGMLFGDEAELMDILSRLTKDAAWGQAMAWRGHEAVVSSKASYADRAREILQYAELMPTQ